MSIPDPHWFGSLDLDPARFELKPMRIHNTAKNLNKVFKIEILILCPHMTYFNSLQVQMGEILIWKMFYLRKRISQSIQDIYFL
jgi:hypothetical protein